MTDYYGILRSAIDETGADTPDARATIYLRAWAALEAQFDSLEVSLPDEARKQQRQLMDEAISRIEREFGATEKEASEATAALDQDAGKTGSAGTGTESDAESASPSVPEKAPEQDEPMAPPGGKMADQAIPDSDAAAPWRAPTGGEAADTATASSARQADKPLPGSPPPRDTTQRGKGGLIAALIVLLLIILGAAGAWWRWDDVQSLMAQVAPPQDTAGEQTAETAETGGEPDMVAAPETQENGETVTRDGGGPATPAETPAEDRQMAAAPDNTAESTASSETPSTTEAQPEPAEAEQQQAQNEVGEAPKDQERVDGTGAVVERAYLIQEADQEGAEDLRYAGQARWSVDGSGDDAVLTIDMQVPERSVALRVTMRENDDAALPASHTIDLIYQGPNDSPNLQDVAGIMTIHDTIENAEPLRAAGALVVPGQYLLALRGGQDDRAANMERLSNAKWLAVRAQFDDRKHAVFLIEKAEKAAAVLEKAMTAWGDSQTGSTQ